MAVRLSNNGSALDEHPASFLNRRNAVSCLTWRRSLVTMLISAALGGCAALQGPDRLKIPANTSDFISRLYAGAAVGNSHLSPDTRGTAFNVDSNSDMGTQIRLGYDVHNLLAVEFDTSVLGTSQLREANTDVKYSSASFSALIYGLSGVQLRSRREGLSAYGRVGMAALKKSLRGHRLRGKSLGFRCDPMTARGEAIKLTTLRPGKAKDQKRSLFKRLIRAA